MNNQLSFAKDPNSTNAIAKSSKVLNSVANLHLRTESNNHDEMRSPERGNSELRQTWRRPRMPYNKLPDAFQIKQKKKKSNKEVLDNLDRIVKINEYKEIQKLLDPISLEKKAQEKPRENSANPLVTIHKYFKMESRFREKMQAGDRSSQKLKTFSTKQPNALRITDCITLEVIKHRHNTGTVKKMLHVPTLKLVCAREEPLSTKDQRVNIKSWLQFWQSQLKEIPQFLNLQGFLFNIPEGAISVVTQYCSNGSLLNLLDSIFTLPESVIRQIFSQIFEGLKSFYRSAGDQFTHFGGLSASQILFNAEGKVKIGMGLYYQLSMAASSTLYNLRSQSKPNPFDLNTTHRTFMKQTQNQANSQIDRSLDVFKLGVLMLQCAIGGLQNFQQSFLIQEALKVMFTEDGQKMMERDNVCCLIHSQSFLLQSVSQQDQRSRRDRIDPSAITPYLKFLKDKFSMPFLNFLCRCLKLMHSQRATLQQLLNHSFLRNEGYKDTKTVQIELNDLLLINSGWNQDLLQSVREEQGQKLVSHILHVLSDCPKEVIAGLLKNEKEKILNIGKYVGLNFLGTGQRLYQTMIQLAQPQRDFNTSI